MNVREFLRQSLIDIASGVSEANTEIAKRKGTKEDEKVFQVQGSERKDFDNNIEFDIAVTVTEEKRGSKEGGLRVSVLNAALGGERASGAEHVSRLKLVVRVLYDID